jgi:hypothetical protein
MGLHFQVGGLVDKEITPQLRVTSRKSGISVFLEMEVYVGGFYWKH